MRTYFFRELGYAVGKTRRYAEAVISELCGSTRDGDRYEEMRWAERRNPFRECRDAHGGNRRHRLRGRIKFESILRNEVILTRSNSTLFGE